MRVLGVATLLFILGSALMFGADTVAYVSSPQPFLLDGVSVPTAGVGSWPLVVGDEITTDRSSAVVRFTDGSRVTVAAQSKARVEKDGKHLSLCFLKGSGAYFLAALSTLAVVVPGHVYTGSTTGTQGTVSTGGTSTPASAGVVRGTGGLSPALLRLPGISVYR